MASNEARKPTYRPLKPGDIVETRAAKPCRRTGRIKEAAGRQLWVIEFEDGGIAQFKSRALQRPTTTTDVVSATSNAHLLVTRPPCRGAVAARAAAAPALEETDVSSSHNEEQELPNLAGMQLDSDASDEEQAAPPASAADLHNDSIDNFEFSEDEEEEEEDSCRPEPPEDYIIPPAGATVDALGEPVEEDVHRHGEVDLEPEDVHKTKWDKYMLDKEQLLSEGWIIAKKGADEGITVGATVRTRARPYREGLVTGQTEDGDGKKQWIVSFGGEEPEEFRPLQLALVTLNAQEYVWTLVDNSEPGPESAPDEYKDGIGVALC
jgi:hypothetical protein